MVLVLSVYGISSISLLCACICCLGCDYAICGVAVCAGDGCGTSELAGGDNGLLTDDATSGDGSALIGSTTG